MTASLGTLPESRQHTAGELPANRRKAARKLPESASQLTAPL